MSIIQGHAGLMFNGFAPQTQAIIDAMIPEPSENTKGAINNAVVSLINAGYFDRFDRFGIMQGADIRQNGLVDWKDPTKAVTLYLDATWVQADGFVGSQTAGSYGGTGFNPFTDGVNYTLNSSSIFVYINAYGTLGGATTGSIFGAYDAVTMTDMSTDATPRFSTRMDSSTGLGITRSVTALAAADFVVLQREAATTTKVYKNGVDVTTSAGDTLSSAAPNAELYLGAINLASVYLPTDVKIASWGAGDEFTGAEQLAIKAIIDTYLAAV